MANIDYLDFHDLLMICEEIENRKSLAGSLAGEEMPK